MQAHLMTFLLKIRKNPFTLIITIMVMYVAFALYVDVGKLSKTSIRIDYLHISLILISIILTTLSVIILGCRFNRFLRALKINNIDLKKSISIYLAGLALTVTPASSGQVIKSQIIKKHYGLPISKTSPIVLIEKWNELNAPLSILIVFALIRPTLESSLIIIVGVGLALFIFGTIRNSSLFNLFRKFILRFPKLKVLEESIENSRDTLTTLSSKRSVMEGFIFTVPPMILQTLSVFLVFNAFGIKIDFITSTQIFYVALISGTLSFIPGGFGITEGSMLALLIKYYDHDVALLATAVIFVRLVTLWYPTLLGIISSQFIVRYKLHNI
jgi:glycosyltransferase 2 family protein